MFNISTLEVLLNSVWTRSDSAMWTSKPSVSVMLFMLYTCPFSAECAVNVVESAEIGIVRLQQSLNYSASPCLLPFYSAAATTVQPLLAIRLLTPHAWSGLLS
jgi:hypothetical protein